MRILACLLCLAALGAAPAVDRPSPKITVFRGAAGLATSKCPRAQITPVGQNAAKPLIHSLDDEPGARQEIAVVQVGADGCPKPVVVRDNVGGKSLPLPPSGG